MPADEIPSYDALTDRISDALDQLLTLGPGRVYAQLTAYVAHMRDSSYAQSSINLRVAAVQSLLSTAHRCHVIAWTVKIDLPKPQTYADTAGPGIDNVRLMIEAAAAQKPGKCVRDISLMRLLFDLGLRRGEIVSLDLEHYDGERLFIMGKGREQREYVSLPEPTVTALEAWLEHRGRHDGPLFVSFGKDGTVSSRHLTGSGLYAVVRALGKRAGVGKVVSPHRLRHSSISALLDHNNGNVRQAAVHSRHRDLSILNRYDDNRKDLQGGAASIVSALV